MRFSRAIYLMILGFGLASVAPPASRAQAAVLLEDADSLSAVFSPLGHESVYFARICAASPTRLRRCCPGELGAVISRYKGIGGYDWLAVPLLPYLYSVENAQVVPQHVNHETVNDLHLAYHAAHLASLGPDVPEGGRIKRGWNQLVGASYERRIYAFRFETTPEQDDAFIARMNAGPNRSHFNILFRNCADLSGEILHFYLSGAFKRRPISDGGLVTPRNVAYHLVRYAQKHPEIRLTVEEIPLIPGFHHRSRLGKTAIESLIVTGYVIPIGFLSPYAGGFLVADFLLWGRDPLPVKQAEGLTPGTLTRLARGTDAAESRPGQMPGSARP